MWRTFRDFRNSFFYEFSWIFWNFYEFQHWLISDLIPEKSEKFEFRKNFVTIFFSVKTWPKKGIFFHSKFYADFEKKWFFSKFLIFQVLIPLLNFEFNFAFFRKLRRRKKSKFRFLGQFLTLKNMVTKFFRNSNFSDFLGIKSEINHYIH